MRKPWKLKEKSQGFREGFFETRIVEKEKKKPSKLAKKKTGTRLDRRGEGRRCHVTENKGELLAPQRKGGKPTDGKSSTRSAQPK